MTDTPPTSRELVERLRDWSEGPNTVDLCDEAAAHIETLEQRIAELDAALEYIVRQNGRNDDGFIDWQRCVDLIQHKARAALKEEGE